MRNDAASDGCAMNSHGFECVGVSHVGLVRHRNEDVLWVDAESGWLLLADGMGGYSGGDVAASLAVATVLERVGRQADDGTASADGRRSALVDGLRSANEAIRLTGAAHPELAGMGATMVAVWLDRREAAFAYVGDSRLYRWRAGCLELLTRDHTVLQEQVDAGIIDPDEARRLPYRGFLTRGLGVAPGVEVDAGVIPVEPADRYLLCSDGLSDMLDDDEIRLLLGAELTVARIAASLVEQANMRGGRDNVSVIVACSAG